MKTTRTWRQNVTAAAFTLMLTAAALADWPMAGHDPQRTSSAPEDAMPLARNPVWCKRLYPFNDPPHPDRINGGYISQKVHIVTAQGATAADDNVYVACARGVYALDPLDGSELWLYETELPAGHSPTLVNGVLYLACYDKRIHAVNAATGQGIWQTLRAGAGFDVNPLVVNGYVYAGCRDGYFYCFDAASGNLAWNFKTDGRISQSAAFQTYPDYNDGVVFFGSNDAYVYALNALDTNSDGVGDLVWKSPQKLPGNGMYSFWPVLHQDRVLVTVAHNYPINWLGPELGTTLPASVSPDGQGLIDAQGMRDHLNANPQRKTFFVLDRSTGAEVETAPIYKWGSAGSNHYPPAIGPNGRVWIQTPWQASHFGRGYFAGWEMGTTMLKITPTSGWESADETGCHSIIGTQYIYCNSGEDFVEKGGIFSLSGGGKVVNWMFATFRDAFGDHYGRWADLQYGVELIDAAGPWGCSGGSVGHQNPPVPLRGRVYFHRSNSVICLGP